MEGQLEGRNDPADGESNDNDDDQSTKVSGIEHAEQKLENSMKPQFQTLDGSYHFTLTGYSLAKGIGPGKYFPSGTFAVGGHEWAVYFYPDGKNPEDHSEFVSVFIALASDSFDVQALFEMTLLDRSGNGKHKTHSHFSGQIKSPYTLRCRGCMWGYKRFYRREVLEKSDFLKDDTLEITGRVGVFLSSIKPTKLITATISPVPQPDDMPQHQSSDDDESKTQNTQVTGSQSEDTFASKVKGLRLEDELARYHLKLIGTQHPIEVRNESRDQGAPTT